MSADLLPTNLQNTLEEIIQRVNSSGGGLRVILLSTAEGVPLGRVMAKSLSNESLKEEILASLESTWAPASKQLSSLTMGKDVKSVAAMYDHGSVVHVYQAPVVSPNLTKPTVTGIIYLLQVL
jgi:hypothetical protein